MKSLEAGLTKDGYVFMQADAMHRCLEQAGPLSDWQAFADSWNDLGPDNYLADKGRYRRRRHAVYSTEGSGEIKRGTHQPHYQSLDYNPLHGGIERWFEPIAPAIGNGASLRTILNFCRALFGGLAPETRAWHIEVHQFRIEAKPNEAGQPTPEGVHRDGVDYVLVLMVKRQNIASGTTTIRNIETGKTDSFTLTAPFDAALVDDARVHHGVTPVQPLDAAAPAYRDVLVVTFRRK